ncbi:MAG: hypothetical protein WC592_05080 [Candidatus Omnitrophota bacterium]|nr:hypothetical protein [Candidatus Omnitrophota bacterium]
MIGLFFAGILAIYSTGFVIRKAVFSREPALLSGPEKFGLDIGFGCGGMALVFFYLSFSGIRLSGNVMMAVTVVFAASALVIIMGNRMKGRGGVPDMPKKPSIKKFDIILVIVIAVSVSVIFFKSLYYPMYEWASRSCFGFKAKILHDSGTIYDKSFIDKEFVIEHPEYPLMVPLLEDWMYTVMRTDDDRFGKGFLPFMALGFLSLMYGAQRRFCGSTHCLVYTLLYSLIYVFVYRFACAEADAPLAFFYFGAGALMFLWICSGKTPYIVSSSLFTAFAIFTKNEATSFFVILTACLLLSLFFSRMPLRDKAKAAFIYMGLTLALSTPWLIYRFTSLPSTDVLVNEKTFFNAGVINTITAKMSRHSLIMDNFIFDIVLKTRKWNLFWILFFVAQILSLKELFKKPVVYLAFIVWSTLILYYTMFILVDLPLDHMLIGMDRFALQVSGLVLLLISLLNCKKLHPDEGGI